MRTSLLIGAAVCLFCTACTPRTVVIRNPGPKTRGIRYYRPKPYLFVAPYTASDVNQGARVASGSTPSDQFVTIELKYMPDFSEEYALQVRTGVGSAKVNITLEDGWRLTQINQELDSQFDENLNALANLLKAAAPGGVFPAPDAPGAQKVDESKAVVRATNVPIGFYEAVIGHGPYGQKQIFGWRYLGFAPYEHCPLVPCGTESENCQVLNLYGLVFDNGIMTFKRLHRIATQGDSGTYVRERNVKEMDDETKQVLNPAESILRPRRLPMVTTVDEQIAVPGPHP